MIDLVVPCCATTPVESPYHTYNGTHSPLGEADETRTDTAEPRGIVHTTTVGAVASGASHATEIFSPSTPTAVTEAEVVAPLGPETLL